jgi:hypothetical protein
MNTQDLSVHSAFGAAQSVLFAGAVPGSRDFR